MKKIKLTKREKIIIGVSLVVTAVVGVNLFKAKKEYITLASKICSGGAWKPEFVSKTRFKLVQVVACCGSGNCKHV